MTVQEVTDHLPQIASAEDCATRSADHTAAWSSAGASLETVEPILRFIEGHPSIDFGMPGPLAHLVEQFYGKGYEQKLVESLQRKPTLPTVWMLNRLINRAKAPDEIQRLVAAMEHARLNALADEVAVQQINWFLERLSH